MSIFYKLLFQVTSSHNYYEDRIPSSISYAPSEPTLRMLKNNRMSFVPVTGGFKIYYQSLDGLTPVVPFASDTFTFILKIEDAQEFLTVTHLDTTKTYSGKKKLFFQNDPQATPSLTHSLIDQVRPSSFTYRIPLITTTPESETVALEITHVSSGKKITLEGIPADGNGVFEVTVDLVREKEGLYTFKSTTSESEETIEESLYINERLSGQVFFGLLQIDFQNDSLPGYELTLERRISLWNFILVNKSNRPDFENILVKDNSDSNQEPYESYTFQKQPDGLIIGGQPSVRFQSNTQIPFYQVPKRDIELVKEVNGNELVLLRNLSNPPLNQISNDLNESDIYVFV